MGKLADSKIWKDIWKRKRIIKDCIGAIKRWLYQCRFQVLQMISHLPPWVYSLSTLVSWKCIKTCLSHCVLVYMFLQMHNPKLQNCCKRVYILVYECLWMHVLLVCLLGLWLLGEGAAYPQSTGFPRSQITEVLMAASPRRTAPQ